MHSEWISPFLDWLITASLRASAIAAGVLLLHSVLGHRLPARWRFALWTPFVLVLLFPVLPDSPLSAARLWSADAAAIPAAVSGLDSKEEAVAAGIPSPERLSVPGRKDRAIALTGLWLAGSGALVLYGSLSWRNRMLRIRAARVPDSPAVRAAVRQACAAAGVRRMPEILCSREVGSPAVTGPWRPVLLLPADFPDALEKCQASLVLEHECVHLRRRDCTWDLLFWLVGAAYWFNPLIALAFTRLRADRELARDAEVLADAGTAERSAYGAALLHFLRPHPAPGFRVGFLGLVSSQRRLRTRVSRLATHRPVRTRWHVTGLLLATVLHLIAGDAKAPAESTVLPGDAAVAKARTIRLAEIKFANAGIDEVVDYLRKKSVDLEKGPVAARTGVDFELHLSGSEAPATVTLQLKNVSIYDAAVAAAKAAGMAVSPSAEGNALRIAPPGEPRKAPAPRGKPPARTAAEAMVVDRLQLSGADLRTAVAMLQAKSKELDPAGKGIAMEIVPGAGDGRRATMELRGTTVWHLATSIAEMCGCAVKADGEKLLFVPAAAR